MSMPRGGTGATLNGYPQTMHQVPLQQRFPAAAQPEPCVRAAQPLRPQSNLQPPARTLQASQAYAAQPLHQPPARTLQASQAYAAQPLHPQLRAQPVQIQPQPFTGSGESLADHQSRRLIARVGGEPLLQPAIAADSRLGMPDAGRTLRFADEVLDSSEPQRQRQQQRQRQREPPSPQPADAYPRSTASFPSQEASHREPGAIARSALRGSSSASSAQPSAGGVSACRSLVPRPPDRAGGSFSMSGSGRDHTMQADDSGASAGSSCRSSMVPRRPPPEPELLVVRLLYLSRLPPGGWLQAPSQYQLSLHVGEDARCDPPPAPGAYSTRLVQAGPAQAVAPEEAALKQRIAAAIDAMCAQENGGSGLEASDLESRYKVRLVVRLSEAGPGPAAGGPVYFRVDAWSVSKGAGLFGGESRPELFARAFVPINEPKWHRRACTWPMIDAAGRDVAYLTCEFTFARPPAMVHGFQVSGVTGSEIRLSWFPPPGEDRVVPVLCYRVEACCLGRGRRQNGQFLSSGAQTWQHLGELDPGPNMLDFVAQNLRPDTRYRFRVCAMNEAGQGEHAEQEAATPPCAPAMCGQPRLAGCNGPVLAVEWDPPTYDGGAEVVAYRVWVRPYTATEADPSDWLEVGQLKHNAAGVQRAEIHTEDLNPNIGRYLCSVAAINAAGEAGPSTPDAVCLTLPNPCHVCNPTPQALPALGDIGYDHARSGADLWQRAVQEPGGLLTMTLMEPGKRKMTVPLNFEGNLMSDMALGLVQTPLGGKSGACSGNYQTPPSDSRFSPAQRAAPAWEASAAPLGRRFSDDLGLVLPDDLDASWQDWPSPADIDSRRWHHMDAFGGEGRFSFEDSIGEETTLSAMVTKASRSRPSQPQPSQRQPLSSDLANQEALEQQEMISHLLEEKRDLLGSSLRRYRQAGDQLNRSPDSERLKQAHEEAEIEAAGYQAEVAVLAQKLNDLSEVLASSTRESSSVQLLSELPYNIDR
ncbi:unnamed protein product [Polarella glacialis]|uniref:Fibronectin type-III domain-containing protein n=1 Tax=Polarella glacialis TaxID=89957 RepID=A0A813HGS8_POLGL|nr:unnamed protein product [Polarella glacialis]